MKRCQKNSGKEYQIKFSAFDKNDIVFNNDSNLAINFCFVRRGGGVVFNVLAMYLFRK